MIACKHTESVIFANMCMVCDDCGNVLVQDEVNPGLPGVIFPGGQVENWDDAVRQNYGGSVKLDIIAHTMEYHGGHMQSSLQLRNYSACDYNEYKKIYEECFHDMRSAYQLYPVDCCYSEEGLEHKKDNIYILEADGKLIGSVAIYGNEIDDLIVRKSCQRMGYGEALLRFAVSHMQTNDTFPITLHVAEWNQGAVRMYLKNGFTIVRTEIV